MVISERNGLLQHQQQQQQKVHLTILCGSRPWCSLSLDMIQRYCKRTFFVVKDWRQTHFSTGWFLPNIHFKIIKTHRNKKSEYEDFFSVTP